MVKIIDVRSVDSGVARVFFDGPTALDSHSYCCFNRESHPEVDWPEGATHFWYSEAGTEHDPNGFARDELGAYLWGQWVISMQDEWGKASGNGSEV